ncbi:hypothetical protein [uncultured Methylobacterium sp.]|uniref:hypothetical protein n=1 Tax=uncultured Methylobacterium sp. TaxID=157278 RepID=UPI0035C9EB81
MQTEPVFTNWTDRHSQLWGNQPVRVEHRLNRSPMFSMEGLAELIDRYPREHYSLVQMGAPGQRKLWREGEIGNLTGAEVIQAISRGRMWLNLRRVAHVDTRYRDLVNAIFGELGERVPGFRSQDESIGILISSPNAQVYYHADLPGQSLWQIHGAKRVYLYPAVKPFLAPEHLEDIALLGVEVNMPYEAWYDEHAQVFEFKAGEMLNWPLNAPHRIENLDCLNVSMTMEYWTEEFKRAQVVTVANAILRHRFGRVAKSRSTEGLGFWSKRVAQRLLRDSAALKRERKALRPISFRLDREHLGEILDLKAA